MSDESRKQFEQWCRDNSLSRDRGDGDGYFFPRTNKAWSAWKASREMLVVELPVIVGAGSTLSTLKVAFKECAEILCAAGITVKGEGDDV